MPSSQNNIYTSGLMYFPGWQCSEVLPSWVSTQPRDLIKGRHHCLTPIAPLTSQNVRYVFSTPTEQEPSEHLVYPCCPSKTARVLEMNQVIPHTNLETSEVTGVWRITLGLQLKFQICAEIRSPSPFVDTDLGRIEKVSICKMDKKKNAVIPLWSVVRINTLKTELFRHSTNGDHTKN